MWTTADESQYYDISGIRVSFERQRAGDYEGVVSGIWNAILHGTFPPDQRYITRPEQRNELGFSALHVLQYIPETGNRFKKCHFFVVQCKSITHESSDKTWDDAMEQLRGYLSTLCSNNYKHRVFGAGGGREVGIDFWIRSYGRNSRSIAKGDWETACWEAVPNSPKTPELYPRQPPGLVVTQIQFLGRLLFSYSSHFLSFVVWRISFFFFSFLISIPDTVICCLQFSIKRIEIIDFSNSILRGTRTGQVIIWKLYPKATSVFCDTRGVSFEIL